MPSHLCLSRWSRLPATLAALAALLFLTVLPGARPGFSGPAPIEVVDPSDPTDAVLAGPLRKTPTLVYAGDPARMTVVWQLTATDSARIEWGTDAAYSLGSVRTSEYGTDHQHRYTLDGLTPGVRYEYRVTSAGYAYPGAFTAAAAPGSSQLKFIAYGDTRTNIGTHDQVAQAIVNTYTADPGFRTFALVVGDLVTDGNSETSWTTEFFNPAYPGVRRMTGDLPYLSCMGNHEGGGALFMKYFPYPFVGDRYWSFDDGPVHVVVVDQMVSYAPGTAQYNWIVADLAASTKPWKFICLHEPGWSAGGGHGNNYQVQYYLQPLCLQYNVSIVFGGHNHYYARAVVSGVQHITTGGGGAPLHTPVPTYPFVVTTAAANHFMTLEIAQGVLVGRAVTPAGVLLDAFTLHEPIDTTPPVVTLTSPNGGEDWKAGSTPAITWSATDYVGVTAVDLAYSTDGGLTYPYPIASGLPNSGSYAWLVPNTPTTDARVRITARDAAGNAGAGASAASFTIGTWTITASAGDGGSIVPSGVVRVPEGASQSFHIVPATGHHIADVQVDGASAGAVADYTFANVTAEHTIAASFALDRHALTVAVHGGGAVTRSPDQPLYDYGTSVDLTAVPSPGWAFRDWSGDAAGTANPVRVLMDGEKSVAGTFALRIAFAFKPHDLHLNAKGPKWVTGYLRPPAPYLASQFDASSIRLNGTVAVSSEQPAKVEDHDATLKVKFARAEVVPTVTAGDHVPVTVTGMIAGQAFIGIDSIKVKAPKIHQPKAGDLLAAGARTIVLWDAPEGAPSVTLLSSLDDGLTWTLEAENIPNSGSCEWTVPSVVASQVRLEVMAVYTVDETGVVPESEFAISDAFSIGVPTGVEDGPAVLALRPSSPVTGPLRVALSLASDQPATLAAYDIGGRRVAALEVGALGSGSHTVDLGSLPTGVYGLRLTQAGRAISARVMVIR